MVWVRVRVSIRVRFGVALVRGYGLSKDVHLRSCFTQILLILFSATPHDSVSFDDIVASFDLILHVARLKFKLLKE